MCLVFLVVCVFCMLWHPTRHTIDVTAMLSAVLGEAEKLRASNKRRARHLAEASEQVTGQVAYPLTACEKPLTLPEAAPHNYGEVAVRWQGQLIS